jgi:putative ubiquitin-RnfH superfamily antitoxin RatB of RatAB toxin-antitoxin module
VNQATNASITLTLLYSPTPRVVDERTLCCALGTTVEQALGLSGLLDDHPEIALQNTEDFLVGIWGRKTSPSHLLRDLDRIEIYRALTVDPMVARRERFQKQGAGRTGLFSKRRPGAKPGY